MNINGRRYLRIIMVRFHAISIMSEIRSKYHLNVSSIKKDIIIYLNDIILTSNSVLNCTDKNDMHYDDSADARKLLEKAKRNAYAIKTFRLDKLKKWDEPNKNTFILTHISKWSYALYTLINKALDGQGTTLDDTRSK